MQFLAEIRSAETWSVGNAVGLAVVVVIIALVLAVAIRVTTRR